jgi:hypothetical protein
MTEGRLMDVTKTTTIHSLITEYPALVEFLAELAPEFEKLKNPVLRNTLARVATLDSAAQMADLDADELIGRVEQAISRQEELKEIIRDLHRGAPVEQVKARFAAAVGGVSGSEIARMEQALVAEGMPVEEVKRLCDVHVEVFREALDAKLAAPDDTAAQIERVHGMAAGGPVALEADHPGHVFQEENREITARIDAAREKDALTSEFTGLAELLERHYVRKENQLFPFLEAHGVTAPPKVMWAVHDDVRELSKAVRAAIQAGDAEGASRDGQALLTMAADMIYKEENIMIPMALEILTSEDWAAVGSSEEAVPGAPAAATVTAPGEGEAEAIPLTTGSLTREQLDLMLSALPADLTFVDADDRVAFFSGGARIFPRSPGVIGRTVQNCHPPKSVHIVERILEAFKAGEKDVAEFWIEMGGRFVHIRYFALRDAKGVYQGVLEVSQDVTAIRALSGERRLLDW